MINDDRFYKLEPDGSIPNGLGIDDKVVTNDPKKGTIKITNVYVDPSRPQTSKYSYDIWDDSLTQSNFTGEYLQPDQPVNEYLIEKTEEQQTDAGSLITSGPIETDMSKFDMPDNYIYFYHLDQFILLPLYADTVQDSMSASFQSNTPLSRSAPIYSYQNSGPRSVQVSFDLHRDMMTDINYQKSNVPLGPQLNDDYVDVLIRYIEAAVLPVYNATNKMVNPPIVAMRLGEDIFIKGVVNGSVGKVFKFPILRNGKYAVVSLSFGISEVEPYDAWDAANYGSYRGLDTTLDKRLRMY